MFAVVDKGRIRQLITDICYPPDICTVALFNNERILVAPLDWGLGHATRCIPVIRALIANGAEPVIAADGGPMVLLKQEFSELEFVVLPGASVRYAKGPDQLGALVRQWPGLLKSIWDEHATLKKIIVQHHINAVISDQRFGLWNYDVPCVLMTHQLHPFTPFAQGLLRKWNRKQAMRFKQIWVVDHETGPNLAGALAHGKRLPPQVNYIGPLSRWIVCDTNSKIHQIVAVISGPEPQRALFQEKILAQLANIPGKHLVVCGTPNGTVPRSSEHIDIIPHLNSVELRNAMCGANLIVARSGYSTIMDLHSLQRSALLVPTPGQSEQEYLAALHKDRGWCMVQQQGTMDLKNALNGIDRLNAPTTSHSEDHLERALQGLAAKH